MREYKTKSHHFTHIKLILFFLSAGSKKEGTGGREVKTKSTKKKGRGRDVDDDSDDEGQGTGGGGGRQQEVSFMDVGEIQKELQKMPSFAECPDVLLKDMAGQLFRY